jgi:O-antigen/teichoic acid export membrane protein
MTAVPLATTEGLGARVANAVMWRSGSQIIAQLLTWSATFFVIRTLRPADYGLYAMTQAVLVMFTFLNGYGFTGALVRAETLDHKHVRQVFGLLLLFNVSIALIQIAIAPLVASYYRQPMVAQLLTVQSLIYLATPFTALPAALLSRAIDYRRQVGVNFLSAVAGAGTALGCAYGGAGVWTLVAAPLALFWTRAIGLTLVSGTLVMPSFRLKGTGATLAFGGAMMASQMLWFVQTQADVFIGGRVMDPHRLGLYTTALFLTQILTSKFVPAVNEIAFSAYARLQDDRRMVAYGFAKSVRIIMLAALPFYLGLAVTAAPFVRCILGPQWVGAIPIVRVLALAMPLVTVQILFAPVVNALDGVRVTVKAAVGGAIIMPAAFLIGSHYGPLGLAWAWLAAFPLFALYNAALALPVIGIGPAALFAAVRPALIAAGGMALSVLAADQLLPAMADLPRLAILVLLGVAVYAVLAWTFAREVIGEIARLILRRRG